MNIDELSINTIRFLSVEAVEKAKSGHPGTPMGAAPVAYSLWSRQLKHNPGNIKWVDRDRFVLSAGHAATLLYSLLHVFGYNVTLEDLKSYRCYKSKTPAHPEYGVTPGVEISTGPLGQGIANGVGMAIAETYLEGKFNKSEYKIINHFTYVLAGDGCMMEGIASEAASLAGTLGLGKLILLYDSNNMTIEGSTQIAFREDVGARFRAYGWQVIQVNDGNDIKAINSSIESAKKEGDKPSLIIVKSVIGYGSPKAGTPSVHGSPLGKDAIESAKNKLGWEYDEKFYVPEAVKENINIIKDRLQLENNEWDELRKDYEIEYPELSKEFDLWMSGDNLYDLDNIDKLWNFDKPISTRQASGEILNKLTEFFPSLIGGSADLSMSNLTHMTGRGDFSKENTKGSNLYFGIREHAMSAIANGISAHGGLRIFVSTYLVFSDYMKASIRMSALMGLPVIYVFTHDSIGVGEDGPTHEPIEQLIGLRTIPNLTVIRPADAKETAAAWCYAINRKDGPTALILTRQTVPLYKETSKEVYKGAYVLKDANKDKIDVLLMASGSEVELIYKAEQKLREDGINARVISVPSFEIFERQSDEYKEKIMPKNIRKRLAVEAGATIGWYKYVGLDGQVIGIDQFGFSAPASIQFEKFGFTVSNIIEKVGT